MRIQRLVSRTDKVTARACLVADHPKLSEMENAGKSGYSRWPHVLVVLQSGGLAPGPSGGPTFRAQILGKKMGHLKVQGQCLQFSMAHIFAQKMVLFGPAFFSTRQAWERASCCRGHAQRQTPAQSFFLHSPHTTGNVMALF